MDTKPKTCSVRKHATDGRVNGQKQIVYVASCSCGDKVVKVSRSARDKWADEHIG
jgi:hypothetical protein